MKGEGEAVVRAASLFFLGKSRVMRNIRNIKESAFCCICACEMIKLDFFVVL